MGNCPKMASYKVTPIAQITFLHQVESHSHFILILFCVCAYAPRDHTQNEDASSDAPLSLAK